MFRALLHHPRAQHHLRWLLWLALLLPAAQAAAFWHGYSHIGTDTRTEGDNKPALHQAHCDLCLIAVAVAGGPLAGNLLTPPPFQVSQATLRLGDVTPRTTSPTSAYHSRAPPFSSSH